MPAALYIRRADGREDDLPSVELAEAIQIFNTIPWKEEIAAWKLLPADSQAERQPVFRLTDDTACNLSIATATDEAISFTFDYPDFRPQFGFAFTDGRDSVSSSDCPRSELETLFGYFFAGDEKAIFSLTAKYSPPSPPQNS